MSRTRKSTRGGVKAGNLTGRHRRPRMPRPPKLSRRELEARARRIADRWLAEINEPLDPRAAGAVIASLARGAASEWDHGYWRFNDAYHCALETVRKYRWHVPQQIWDMLSAWALLDVCGAIRR